MAKSKSNSLPKPNRTRVIAICNQKGGCGKTTTVINLGASLAHKGLKVLIVDLDSQANATTGVGVDPARVDMGTFELLCEPKSTALDDILKETSIPGLNIAPATIQLSEFESRIANELGRENRLKKALANQVSQYDFVLIDTPPSLGLLSVNALNAAQEVFIAMQAHPFALDGLHLLLDSIQAIQEELNPELKITGVVTTMFDPRTKISREITASLKTIPIIQEQIFSAVIRQNIKLTESSKFRVPICLYAPDSPGAEDYAALAKEVCLDLRHKSPKDEDYTIQRASSSQKSAHINEGSI